MGMTKRLSPTRNMKYGLDIDGVVCDFLSGARSLADKLKIDVSDRELVLDYEFLPDEYEKVLEDYPFWLNMKPIRSSWHVVNDLFSAGHDVYFITSRRKESSILATTRWLNEWNFMYSDVRFTNGKGKVDLYKELELDMFVDDDPQVVSDISEIGLGILMNQIYNEYDESRVRIDDLSDLYQLSGGL